MVLNDGKRWSEVDQALGALRTQVEKGDPHDRAEALADIVLTNDNHSLSESIPQAVDSAFQVLNEYL